MLFFLLPKREIFLKKLNDGLGISESFLVNVIDLLESLSEGLLSKFARLLVVVHHFIVEDGEIEGKTKSNRIAGIEALRGLIG